MESNIIKGRKLERKVDNYEFQNKTKEDSLKGGIK